MAPDQVDFSNLPDKWSLLLTRPNGGVVGKFGEPWERCPAEFPRINVYSHPPEAVLPEDRMRSILTANGIDPDVYLRAQHLLRQAVQAGPELAAPTAQVEPVAAIIEALPEVVKPLNEVPVVPAEVVKPLNEEPVASM
jgi:hypothetical protein